MEHEGPLWHSANFSSTSHCKAYTMRKEHARSMHCCIANANVKKVQLQVASLEKALKGKVGRKGGRNGEGAESCLFIPSYRTRRKKSWLRYVMI